MEAAFQSGIAVPGKVSIVGFDDIDIAPFTIPPLTTIRQSGFELGEAAATLLLDMIQQGRESAEVEDIVADADAGGPPIDGAAALVSGST